MVDQPDFLQFPPGGPPRGPQTSQTPQALLCLEVTRGRTAYPYRPIEKPKFRLGSGPACDLRLGGILAPVHSLILVEAGRAWAEQVAADPPLTVNGTPRRRADLAAGDRLRIGEFEMVFWRVDWDPTLPDEDPEAPEVTDAPLDIDALLAEADEAGPTASLQAATDDEAGGTPDLARLSAAELIELIEQEEAVVAEFEAGRERGAAALLFRVAMQAAELREMDETPLVVPESAAEFAAESDAAADEIGADEADGEANCLPLVRLAVVAADDEGLLGELEQVVGRLSEFSAQLDRRAEQLTRRELTQAEAAARLLAAQEELASQLEQLHDQLAPVRQDRQDREPPAYRKAA